MHNSWMRRTSIMALLAATALSTQADVGEINPHAAIHERLDAARDRQAADATAQSALTRDLVMLADFEQNNVVFLADANFLTVPLEPGHYGDGKFGRGFYFEAPQLNQFPPAMADVEANTEGFLPIGKAVLETRNADTQFGRRALTVTVSAHKSGFKTQPIRVTGLADAGGRLITFVASCYVKGPQGVRLSVKLTLLPTGAVTKPKVADTVDDMDFADAEVSDDMLQSIHSDMTTELLNAAGDERSMPCEVELNGTWQRIACLASAKTPPAERRAVFSLVTLGPEPVTLWVDGFQLEPTAYYPHGHTMPSTWCPGGERRPATTVDIAGVLKDLFPRRAGTLSFWQRTPANEANLPKRSVYCWLSFGEWWTGNWRMGFNCAAGSDAQANVQQGDALDGRWHHMAMTWDETRATVYWDGVPRGTFDRNVGGENPFKPREAAFLRLGGYVANGAAANAILDDVALFRRSLNKEEIAGLAGLRSDGEIRLSLVHAGWAFDTVARRVFYRDEAHATVDIGVLAVSSAAGTITIDYALGDVVAGQQRVPVGRHAARIGVKFAPSRLACGTYVFRIGCLGETNGAYTEFPVEVVPALRPDHFMLSSWGGFATTAEERAFCKRLGLNTLDAVTADLDQLGREGFLYGWHYNYFGDGIASPAHRDALRERTRVEAEHRAPFPNWKYTLLNSERGGPIPDDENRRAWFDTWAAKELNFPIPTNGWALGGPHNPGVCWFTEDEKPGTNGVYRACRTGAFMTWWLNRGCGAWRLNAEAAVEIKRQRSDVKTWTDPLRSAGQIADLDAGGTWSYSIHPEKLIGEFEQAYAFARGTGKEFYATLGMHYVDSIACIALPSKPDPVKSESEESAFDESIEAILAASPEKDQPIMPVPVVPKGKAKANVTLAPTADDMIQQAWIAVTRIPTDGLTYWWLTGLYQGLKDGEGGRVPSRPGWFAEPDSDRRLGDVLRSDLLPLGTLLKSVPNAQRPIALLLPESTLWPVAGEGGWWWGVCHYPNFWKVWLSASGLPYDILTDRDIRPGSLKGYQAILFPMAVYVSDPVYREVCAAAEDGVRVIVDQHCRQTYPRMERWELDYDRAYFDSWTSEQRKAYEQRGARHIENLKEQLRPDLEVYAEGTEGPVFTSVRERKGVRYISVINNLRQPGPYTEWTQRPDFKPYGRAQRATVFLKGTNACAVYEFTESRRLPVKIKDGRRTVTIDLPPHAGRMLCVYPEPLTQLDLQAPAVCKKGESVALAVSIRDDSGALAPGRQLIEATITDPAGRLHDESGLYRMDAGQADIPFRPAINDPAGKWRIRLIERQTGLKVTRSITVK